MRDPAWSLVDKLTGGERLEGEGDNHGREGGCTHDNGEIGLSGDDR